MRLLALVAVALVPLLSSASTAPRALGEARTFPLLHTHLDAEVAGPLARVAVVQRFGNAHDVPIEVVYTFPLPADAAVDAFSIRTGERAIHGTVVEREEARRMYEEARDRGWLAARLDQERPNVFTQRVANVLPGEEVEVELRFTTTATWLDGGYELALPLVVGPRFHPGVPLQTSVGEGTAADTDLVPDASLVSPPWMPPGVTGPPASLRVRVEAGVAVGEITSPSHSLQLARTGASTFEVAVDGAIPNQDFVLRWEPSAAAPEVSLIAHRSAERGTFLVQIQPPAVERAVASTPREIVLLLDSSGSMAGHPIRTSRAVAQAVLEHLDPQDAFQIIDFAQQASSLSAVPLPGTPANVERGLSHLATLRGAGGTHMLSGIRAALAPPADPQRLRIVLLLTDGYIGNEHTILAEVRELLGGARLFALGVGTSVNRFLLDELAAEGRGAVDYVRPDEDSDVVAARFRRRIERPVLTDLVLQADGVRDLQPRSIPDLFAGQPVTLFGRYDGHGHTDLVLRGRANGRPWMRRLRVELPEREERFAVLGAAWARAEIGERIRENWLRPDSETVEAITRLALTHQIVAAWTSFVAVEAGARTGVPARQVVQPVPPPAGVESGRVVAGLLGNPGNSSATGLGLGGLGSRGGGRAGSGTGLGLGGLGTSPTGRGAYLRSSDLRASDPGTGDEYGRKEGKRAVRARLTVGAVEASEEDKAAVEELVARHLGELQLCYERARPSGTELRLRLSANAERKVRLEPAADSTDTAFERCAAAVVGSWQFPSATSRATVILRREL